VSGIKDGENESIFAYRLYSVGNVCICASVFVPVYRINVGILVAGYRSWDSNNGIDSRSIHI
jgi:hypothetical protein